MTRAKLTNLWNRPCVRAFRSRCPLHRKRESQRHVSCAARDFRKRVLESRCRREPEGVTMKMSTSRALLRPLRGRFALSDVEA
jgi:hypothetical protein